MKGSCEALVQMHCDLHVTTINRTQPEPDTPNKLQQKGTAEARSNNACVGQQEHEKQNSAQDLALTTAAGRATLAAHPV